MVFVVVPVFHDAFCVIPIISIRLFPTISIPIGHKAFPTRGVHDKGNIIWGVIESVVARRRYYARSAAVEFDIGVIVPSTDALNARNLRRLIELIVDNAFKKEFMAILHERNNLGLAQVICARKSE